MKQKFPNVEPFSVGYDGPEIRIQYPVEFWDAMDMGEGRIHCHLRQAVLSADIYFEADTATGSILREPEGVLLLIVPAIATALMKPPYTVFDFIHEFAGIRKPLPGLFYWPVTNRVTRNV